ncbi:MAG: MAPEG family protein [Cellvibrionaceae bacterium]|nr:MAPEG family protein [Cellvibrionaceae bacterium]
MPQIIPFYASLLALLFIFLSVKVVRLRRTLRTSIGDAGDKRLLRAIRVHSNFAEYTPLALLLLLALELQVFNSLVLHILGIALVTGRLLHAYGVSQTNERLKFRVAGMACTFTVLLVTAGVLIYRFAMRAFIG